MAHIYVQKLTGKDNNKNIIEQMNYSFNDQFHTISL